MPRRLLSAVQLALLCLPTLPIALAQAPAVNLAAVADWTPIPIPSPPTVSDPANIFPLSSVRAGLHGIAWTVFQGTQPEAMQVEILGVLHDAIGPGQDMILARLRGDKPEYTGVVAGMSGSPVYVDGKLLGALSYRIGQFTKEPIAGITPIEQMLQVKDRGAAQAAEARRSEPETAGRPISGWTNEAATGSTEASAAQGSPLSSNAADGPTRDQGWDGQASLVPMETPLVFDGFSPQTMRLLGGRFTAMGMQPIAGLGGASPESKQPQPIVPGSAVSAILVRGDLNIAATCSVTYVDPRQLLACGHPITQFGDVSLPMTKADVVLTLASPLNSFKIINTTETVGSFTEDRMNAIYGRFGEAAKMIPVTVTVHPEGLAAGVPPHVLHFEVLNNPKLTPQAVLVSVYQALQGTNASADEESYRMSGALEVAGHAPVQMEALLSPTDQIPASLQAAMFLNERFSRIYGNDAQKADIRSLGLDFQALPGRKEGSIDSARLSTTEARPGETIDVEITLRPYHGEQRTMRLPVKLPASLTPGAYRILVSDAETLDRMLQPAPFVNQQPLPLDATIAQINRLHRNDRVYVTLLDHTPQAVLQEQALPSLPISMANVLQPLRNSQRLSLTGESASELGSAAAGLVPSGMQVLDLTVR